MKTKKTTGLEIAIVGMSGKFPNAENIGQLWEKLIRGEELLDFATEETYKERNIDLSHFEDPDRIQAYSNVADASFFDAPFFKYQKSEAKLMDPQIRVFHEMAWAALEDAGIVPKKNNAIGVYAGANDNLLWKAHNSFFQKDPLVTDFMSSLLCDKDRLSTLISYKLNLNGPSLFFRTGCSTSLVATHMACRALLTGECDTAIAGGVTISSQAIPGYKYAENMIFSSDGHTKTFDANSDGTVFTNGGAAIVLKRLEKAKKDNDHIYAVIKGSAINNDGASKIGYTAPGIEGQVKCIKRAHKISKIDINNIAYVEAHGTGTTLGDPIEVEALNAAFEAYTNEKCYVGSVKSNLGHMGAASGIVGLIKTALLLKHKQIPASIHFSTPNPKIPFDKGPFVVADKLTPLPKNEETLTLASVSSFGIGGTNAHMILEEYPDEETDIPSETKPLVFPFSAKNKESLERYLEQFSQFLQTKGASTSLSDIAHTLQYGRKPFQYRTAVTAKNHEELLGEISAKIPMIEHQKSIQKLPPKIVFMFPGQGVQYFGMGKELYENAPVFRTHMDRGFSLLLNIMNVDFKSMLFEDSAKEELLHDTKYTHPILFVFQYALSRYLESIGITPSYLIGHSFGEYTAACLSGVLSFEDTLKILIKRGEVMGKLPEGRMLGVSLGVEAVQSYLNDKLSVASINTPNQCILSGEKQAILDVMKAFEADDIKHRLLKISFASHSFMIYDILEEYQSFLDTFHFKEATLPFISNITGELVTGEEGRTSSYWCDHLSTTVNFSKGIKTLDAIENLVFVEIGPGDSLARLYKQNKLLGSKNAVVNIVRNGFDELTTSEIENYVHKALGTLWTHNAFSDWSSIKETSNVRKISLPTYAFQRVSYPTYINTDEILQMLGGGKMEEEYLEKVNTLFSEKEAFDAQNTSEDKLLEELKEIWKVFFGIEDVDVTLDFFEFGGDSLKGMTMIKILNERYQIKVPIKIFFKNSVLLDLSKEIKQLVRLNNKKSYKNKITI